MASVGTRTMKAFQAMRSVWSIGTGGMKSSMVLTNFGNSIYQSTVRPVRLSRTFHSLVISSRRGLGRDFSGTLFTFFKSHDTRIQSATKSTLQQYRQQILPMTSQRTYCTIVSRCSSPVLPLACESYFGNKHLSHIFVTRRLLKTSKRQTKRYYRWKNKYRMKTKKAVASRFKLTKSGIIKYWRRGRVHNSQAKTKKQHRQLRKPKFLRNGTMFKKLRRAMQY
eukprot:gene5035-126_t